MVSSVADEALATIDKLYPDRLAADADETTPALPPVDATQSVQVVPATAHGYVQLIDAQKLTRFAISNNITLRVDAGTGDFVTGQGPLVSLIGFDRPVDEATTKTINSAFSIRRTRTVDEEIAFCIRQLTDITLKNLSPSSSDITTAVLTIDYLCAVLTRLVQRQLQPTTIGQFIPRHPSFANIMDGALDQIRDVAGGNTVILTRLLVLIQVVSRQTTIPARRAVLRHHAHLVAEQADATLYTNYQRNLVRQQLVETLLTLDEKADAFDDLLKPV